VRLQCNRSLPNLEHLFARSRGLKNSVEVQARVDAARFLDARNESRIRPQRSFARFEQRRLCEAFRIWRKQPGAGPRRRASGFGNVVNANVASAPSEFECDRQAYEAAADDRDVVRAQVRLHTRVDGAFSALRRHPSNDLVRIDDVARLAVHAVGEVDL
jgi:hypothetical protein